MYHTPIIVVSAVCRHSMLLIITRQAGGTLLVHGERQAAALLQRWFGKSTWKMDGDFYRRTVHELDARNTLLEGPLKAEDLPGRYNVKACMLSGVPAGERLYSVAQSGSETQSGVPWMSNLVRA